MEIIQTDAAGRICIPEKLLHALGLKPGMKFQIKLQGNGILLTKLEAKESPSEDEEIHNMMELSEESLKDFLVDEPDLYTEKDLKVKYQ